MCIIYFVRYTLCSLFASFGICFVRCLLSLLYALFHWCIIQNGINFRKTKWIRNVGKEMNLKLLEVGGLCRWVCLPYQGA
ncbi:Uncharacterised protein [Comamonas testosteroni]|uniref:Uncharacterized protein n=1 Tax=Comamonas testosteroni TaxID=285 RepID=A0A8B4S6C0_COMTE|nr:Uncharacterised protein [Comamonas testosteroni]